MIMVSVRVYFPKLKVQVKGQIFTSKVKCYYKSLVKLIPVRENMPGFSFGKNSTALSDTEKTRTWNAKALITGTFNYSYQKKTENMIMFVEEKYAWQILFSIL